MAHKKGLGSSRNGRDSESKRLGVKAFAGEFVKAGSIINANVAPPTIRPQTSVSGATTLCLRLRTAS